MQRIRNKSIYCVVLNKLCKSDWALFIPSLWSIIVTLLGIFYKGWALGLWADFHARKSIIYTRRIHPRCPHRRNDNFWRTEICDFWRSTATRCRRWSWVGTTRRRRRRRRKWRSSRTPDQSRWTVGRCLSDADKLKRRSNLPIFPDMRFRVFCCCNEKLKSLQRGEIISNPI